jgi:TonB-dependent receptor
MKKSIVMTGIALAVSQAFAPVYAEEADKKVVVNGTSEAESQVVVVSGIRASARSSVAIKRDSAEVVDSITAEDIGKLPDPNVAETLTRIPGVQGYRYGGEGASPVGAGSGLTIRGLSGQTASQVNGRAFFTAGGREFNIEGAIPGMVAGIDVYKNPTAEHIEGGIGGLVNIRTRNPSDFKSLTASLAVNGRWNDLAKKYDPELFGLVANRFDLGGGQRIGVLAAAMYQKSTGRSDNNPANGGSNLKRVVRADSAEYATRAAGNTSNNPAQPLSAYVGHSDVSFLDGGTMPTASGQDANLIAAPALTSNAFQETIMRERKGLNLAADWRVSNTLRFYTEANYIYYLYHQNYRGLNSVDGGNVQNLQTTPFALTEGLVNRNSNGGSDDVLVSKRFLSGSMLNSTVNTVGGDEHRPYTTWIGAGGVEWSPTDALSLKLDLSYIKSDQTQDNRSVNMDSAPGLSWSTNRLADGAPHQLSFTGPSLSDPNNFVFRDYNNGTNQSWDDKGYAAAFSGSYSMDGLFNKIKFGSRYAHQQSLYSNVNFSGRPLTTDGKGLVAITRANGIKVGSTGVWELAPTNFMRGDAGYSGGYVVYQPDALLGNQVKNAFPNAGILAEGSYLENLGARRFIRENTTAVYGVGEFAAMDDRLKGNIGVRVVRTEGRAIAKIADLRPGAAAGALVDNVRDTSYNNVLPSANVTYDITKDFLARFGYGKSLTRAGLGDLNPSISANVTAGTANIGNPDLRPQTANSFDISLERYFSPTNYVAAAVFDKEINGFFNAIVECQTLPVPYTGGQSNSCSNGQWQVSKSVNSEKGYARGVELSGQYFFDSSYGMLNNFGLSGSYTYVKTSNPVNFGTAAAPRIVDTPQPFQSKNNFSISGMYEDNKLSARVVYTWRSPSILFGVSTNPIDGRYIGSYGILDASLNYEIAENLTVSFNGSNLTDKALNRFVGEPGTYQTGLERQHYANGRTFSVGLRYKFGGK